MSPDEPELSVRHQLATLLERFEAELPARLQRIEQAWREGSEDLARHIHSLCGSAATLGYRSVASSAEFLDRDLASGGPSDRFEDGLRQLALAIASPVTTGPARTAPPSASDRGGDRILIVEDDHDAFESLRLQLEPFGYLATHLPDPEGLLDEVDRIRPAAILMDIVFPDGEGAGLRAAEAFRRRGLDLPLIFTSIRTDLRARLGAVRAGCHAYFPKPIAFDRLIEELDVLTARKAQEPYRVLVVDDDPAMLEYIDHTLSAEGMRTATLADPMRIMEPLIDFRPDLIVMDLHMPGCSGLELAAVIRHQPAHLALPIVFLSGDRNDEKRWSAMLQGGDDFLNKPIEPDHLVTAIRARIGRYRIIQAQIARDSLTGLWNRGRLLADLERELGRAERDGSQVTFAMLDLDHFKRVNDSYGHPVGDRVLRNLSNLLKTHLRRMDLAGRFGGEEFAVLLPGVTATQARPILERIRTEFAHQHQTAGDHRFQTTFSAGLASFPEVPTRELLLARADHALYEAKAAGRNRVVCHQVQA